MLIEQAQAKPFLKWAGGKRQLLDQFEDKYPEALKNNRIKTYIEPFVGGGAVFFDLIGKFNFQKVVLNDINEELIITYMIVRDELDFLISKLKVLEYKYLPLDLEGRKQIYYDIRDRFNQEKKEINYSRVYEDTIQHAAHFIFLNRTCFNGLYRQNKKGEFNVPIGRYKMPTICDEDTLKTANSALKNVNLISCDFEESENYIDDDTFVYLDPPYRPLPGTTSFTKYSRADFNEKSQKRLANWYHKVNDKFNAKKDSLFLMLSNSNPKNTDSEDDFFENLYEGFLIDKVFAKRSINSKTSERGEITELLIRNY